MSVPEGFCTICSGVIQSFDGLRCCPHCQTKNLPCSYYKQVTVNINLHELHILFVWAENYQAIINEKEDQPGKSVTIYSIANRLKKQLPPGSVLTMKDEFESLREAGIKFDTNHPASKESPDPIEH